MKKIMAAKKITVVLMSLIMLISFAACGQTGSGNGGQSAVSNGPSQAGGEADNKNQSDNTNQADNPNSEGLLSEGGKTLVVYFSWSSAGNTEKMANLIQEQTKADLLELEPLNPYPEDYQECADVALAERDSNARPEIANLPPSIQEYDTIFIGYPIWWHTAPMIIGTFLESYDLSGKDVYPFAQSTSMDREQFENSMDFVRESAKGAQVHDGLFTEPSDTNGIIEYLTSNGLITASTEDGSYESAEDRKVVMSTENTNVVVTLNGSRAAAEFAEMLPLELTLVERDSFAKGMKLPWHLSSDEETTREYRIGDLGYWNAGPDIAVFYDDIYDRTIVEIIPLGHAETGAEAMANETGKVSLKLMEEE